LYFVFVAFGHAIYTFIVERFRLTKTFVTYILTSTASFLAFLPWIFVILANLDNVKEVTSGAQDRAALPSLVKAWIANLGQVFWDVGLGTYLAPIIFILAGYAIYFVCRHSPKKVWLFLLTLIGATGAIIILPDLILGGSGSMRSRYFIPCYLGIQLAVAYLLATQMSSFRFYRHKLWSAIAVILISGGVISCVMSSQSEAWWNKGHSQYNLEVTQIINQADRPLLVTNTNSFNTLDILSLSHSLDSKVRLLLVLGSEPPKIPDGFSDIFSYNPSDSLIAELEKDYRIEQVHDRIKLLHLVEK
jgi:uncharacterized membrane protein